MIVFFAIFYSLLLGSMIFVPTLTKAQISDFTVIVLDESGFPPASILGPSPLYNITAKLTTQEGVLIRSQVTDQNGTAKFRVESGEYRLILETGGAYFSNTMTKTNVTSQSLDVVLAEPSEELVVYLPTIMYHSFSPGSALELEFIDLNSRTNGTEVEIHVRPGEAVHFATKFWERPTENVPVWYVSLFGSWQPSVSLANLEMGVSSPVTNESYYRTVEFQAPTVPGEYEVRVLGNLDYSWPLTYRTAFHYWAEAPGGPRDMGVHVLSKGPQGPYGIGTIVVVEEESWSPMGYLLLGVAGTLGLIALGAYLWSNEGIRLRIISLFVPLLAKQKNREGYDKTTQNLILGFIIGRPGCAFIDIVREFGLGHGVVFYHLDCLKKEGWIVKKGTIGRPVYYGKEQWGIFKSEVGELLGELDPTDQMVIKAIRDPMATFSASGLAVFKSPKAPIRLSLRTVQRSLNKLTEIELVQREGKGTKQVYRLMPHGLKIWGLLRRVASGEDF